MVTKVRPGFDYVIDGLRFINDKARLLKINFHIYAGRFGQKIEGDITVDSYFMIDGEKFTLKDYVKLEKKVLLRLENDETNFYYRRNRYIKLHNLVLKYGWNNLDAHHTPIDPRKPMY